MRVKLKYLGLLALLLVLGLVAAITVIRHGLSARDRPSTLEMVVAKTVRSVAVPSHAKELANPVPNIPENLAQAEAHWADHCASCHANNGSGDTVIGRNLYPKAPDMRLAATQNQTDGELYYTIENGIRMTGMPAWGDGGDSDEDSWKLVLFVRYLPRLSAQEEKRMEKMNPKSAEDRAEEEQEEKFLNGGQVQPPNDQSQKHHH